MTDININDELVESCPVTANFQSPMEDLNSIEHKELHHVLELVSKTDGSFQEGSIGTKADGYQSFYGELQVPNQEIAAISILNSEKKTLSSLKHQIETTQIQQVERQRQTREQLFSTDSEGRTTLYGANTNPTNPSRFQSYQQDPTQALITSSFQQPYQNLAVTQHNFGNNQQSPKVLIHRNNDGRSKMTDKYSGHQISVLPENKLPTKIMGKHSPSFKSLQGWEAPAGIQESSFNQAKTSLLHPKKQSQTSRNNGRTSVFSKTITATELSHPKALKDQPFQVKFNQALEQQQSEPKAKLPRSRFIQKDPIISPSKRNSGFQSRDISPVFAQTTIGLPEMLNGQVMKLEVKAHAPQPVRMTSQYSSKFLQTNPSNANYNLGTLPSDILSSHYNESPRRGDRQQHHDVYMPVTLNEEIKMRTLHPEKRRYNRNKSPTKTLMRNTNMVHFDKAGMQETFTQITPRALPKQLNTINVELSKEHEKLIQESRIPKPANAAIILRAGVGPIQNHLQSQLREQLVAHENLDANYFNELKQGQVPVPSLHNRELTITQQVPLSKKRSPSKDIEAVIAEDTIPSILNDQSALGKLDPMLTTHISQLSKNQAISQLDKQPKITKQQQMIMSDSKLNSNMYYSLGFQSKEGRKVTHQQKDQNINVNEIMIDEGSNSPLRAEKAVINTQDSVAQKIDSRLDRTTMGSKLSYVNTQEMMIQVDKYKQKPTPKRVNNQASIDSTQKSNERNDTHWDQITQGTMSRKKDQGCTPLSLNRSNFSHKKGIRPAAIQTTDGYSQVYSPTAMKEAQTTTLRSNQNSGYLHSPSVTQLTISNQNTFQQANSKYSFQHKIKANQNETTQIEFNNTQLLELANNNPASDGHIKLEIRSPARMVLPLKSNQNLQQFELSSQKAILPLLPGLNLNVNSDASLTSPTNFMNKSPYAKNPSKAFNKRKFTYDVQSLSNLGKQLASGDIKVHRRKANHSKGREISNRFKNQSVQKNIATQLSNGMLIDPMAQTNTGFIGLSNDFPKDQGLLNLTSYGTLKQGLNLVSNQSLDQFNTEAELAQLILNKEDQHIVETVIQNINRELSTTESKVTPFQETGLSNFKKTQDSTSFLRADQKETKHKNKILQFSEPAQVCVPSLPPLKSRDLSPRFFNKSNKYSGSPSNFQTSTEIHGQVTTQDQLNQVASSQFAPQSLTYSSQTARMHYVTSPSHRVNSRGTSQVPTPMNNAAVIIKDLPNNRIIAVVSPVNEQGTTENTGSREDSFERSKATTSRITPNLAYIDNKSIQHCDIVSAQEAPYSDQGQIETHKNGVETISVKYEKYSYNQNERRRDLSPNMNNPSAVTLENEHRSNSNESQHQHIDGRLSLERKCQVKHKDIVKSNLSRTYRPHGIGAHKGPPIGSGEYMPVMPLLASTQSLQSPQQDQQEKQFYATSSNLKTFTNDFTFGQPTEEQFLQFVQNQQRAAEIKAEISPVKHQIQVYPATTQLLMIRTSNTKTNLPPWSPNSVDANAPTSLPQTMHVVESRGQSETIPSSIQESSRNDRQQLNPNLNTNQTLYSNTDLSHTGMSPIPSPIYHVQHRYKLGNSSSKAKFGSGNNSKTSTKSRYNETDQEKEIQRSIQASGSQVQLLHKKSQQNILIPQTVSSSPQSPTTRQGTFYLRKEQSSSRLITLVNNDSQLQTPIISLEVIKHE